jgi:hypothetical protein
MLSTTSQKAKAYKASLYSKKRHKKRATALMVATATAVIRVTHHMAVPQWQESGVTRRDKCCFEQPPQLPCDLTGSGFETGAAERVMAFCLLITMGKLQVLSSLDLSPATALLDSASGHSPLLSFFLSGADVADGLTTQCLSFQ